MNRATPQMRSIAKRLLATETPVALSTEAVAPTLLPVIDKLRPHLAILVGKGGVRALLARSLALASAEISWLQAIQVNADGDLEGLEAFAPNLEQAEFSQGKVVLLAHLLGLLVAFIGPSLTLRLIGEVWPQIPLKKRDFGKENDREKGE